MKYFVTTLLIVFSLAVLADDPKKEEPKKTTTEVKTPPPSVMPYDSLEVVMMQGKRVFYYKNELYSGTVKQYLQVSNVNLEYVVKNGVIQKLNGFYPNGSTEREYEYKNGVEHGRFVLYHQNGMVSMDQTFENGSLHGDQIIYGPNGEIKEHNTYKHGEKQKKQAQPVLQLDDNGEWY